MLRKAAMQLHIGAGSGASPSRIEGFREFEADLSALFNNHMIQIEYVDYVKDQADNTCASS